MFELYRTAFVSEEKEKDPQITENNSSQETKKSVGEQEKDEGSSEDGPVELGDSHSVSDDGCEMEDSDSRIAPLQEKIKELEESILRVKAEADNIRKRAVKDVEAAHKFGKEKFVREILPVKDSLEMGLESAKKSDDVTSVVEGFSLTSKMFTDVLARLEVQEVYPLEEAFDPERHQAMTTEYIAGKNPGIVVRVFQKGYLLNGRLVRPALVVVSAEKTDEST